jgi:hypothetical protein
MDRERMQRNNDDEFLPVCPVCCEPVEDGLGSVMAIHLFPCRERLCRDAERYNWLREHLEFINFDGLTTDTCDVGLDYAIDRRIAGVRFGLLAKDNRR